MPGFESNLGSRAVVQTVEFQMKNNFLIQVPWRLQISVLHFLATDLTGTAWVKISRLDDAQESPWMWTVPERSGEIWLVHWASKFKLNISIFVSVLVELFNRSLYSPPNLIPTSSKWEGLFPSRPLSMASVLGSLFLFLPLCLPLCVSLHHSPCSYVSDSFYLYPTSLMNRLSISPRLGRGVDFNMDKSKDTVNKVFVGTVAYFFWYWRVACYPDISVSHSSSFSSSFFLFSL